MVWLRRMAMEKRVPQALALLTGALLLPGDGVLTGKEGAPQAAGSAGQASDGGSLLEQGFTLSPEMEAEWRRVIEAARPLRVEKETRRVEEVIAAVGKTHGLSEEALKRLRGVAPAVVAETVRDWERAMRGFHRHQLQGEPQAAAGHFARMKDGPVRVLAGHEIPFELLPQERETFVNAMRGVLPPETFAEWNGRRLRLAAERKAQARVWLEAGLKRDQPAAQVKQEVAGALKDLASLLGADSEAYRSAVKRVDDVAAEYERVCVEYSRLRLDSFVIGGPGWTEAKAKGWFFSRIKRADRMGALRQELGKRLVDQGAVVLAATAQTKWEAEDFKLAPEVEVAWEKRMVEARVEHRRQKQGRLEREVERLRKAHGLTEAGAAALKRAIPGLIEAGQAAWEQSMRRFFRPGLTGEAGPALRQMERRITAKWLGEIPGDYRTETLQGKAWEEAVRRHLGTEALAAWEKERAAGLEQRKQETEALVAAGLEKMEPEKPLRETLRDWAQDLGVPVEDEKDEKDEKGEEGEAAAAEGPETPAWVAAFQRRIGELAKAYAEACVAKSREWMDVCPLDGPTWRDARKKGFYFSHLPAGEWTKRSQEELMKLVPEDLRVRQAAEKEALAKREAAGRAQARLLVVEHVVTLSAEQRAAVLEAAAVDAAKDDGFFSVDGRLALAEEWTGEAWKRLEAILDDRQERLAAQGLEKLRKGDYREAKPAVVEPLRHPDAGPQEAGEVEAALAAHLAEDARLKAQTFSGKLLRRVDEVARVTALDERGREALELAARGTVELQLERQRRNVGSYLRSQLEGAEPRNVRQRLASAGTYGFSLETGKGTPLAEAMERELSQAQKQALAANDRESRERRQQQVVALLLARCGRDLQLTQAQHEKLERATLEVLKTYGEDIDAMFSRWGERTPWYLQTYYQWVPMAGLKEAELKELLSPRQRQKWEAFLSNRGGDYWGQVMEEHDRRKKGQTMPGGGGFFFISE